MSDSEMCLSELVGIFTESDLDADTQIVVRMPSYLEGAGQVDGEEIFVTRLEVDAGFGSEESVVRFFVEPSLETEPVTMADVLRMVDDGAIDGDPIIEIELVSGLLDVSWDGRHRAQTCGAVRSTGGLSRLVIRSEPLVPVAE